MANDAIWLEFMNYMNTDYSGDSNRWFGGVVASDKAVRCYMEAGWEFYNEQLPASIWTAQPPSFKPNYWHWAFAISAVDAQHRYILNLIKAGDDTWGRRDIETL
jgi:hypothetical protein